MNILKNRTFLLIASGGLFLSTGIALWIFRASDAAQVDKVRQLGEQLMGESGRQLKAEERRELAGELRKEMAELSPDQRKELMQGRRKAMQQEMDKLFKLPKPEQVAMLDKSIDRMESMRQRFEAMRSQNPSGGANSQGNSPGREVRQRTPPTKKDREQRALRRLNNTTPEERARMAEFMKLVQKRRQERGLPELTFSRPR